MVNNRAAPGAKTRLIEQVLSHIGKRCPDIAFALTDKDISKINAVKEVLPSVKHQLCYWHVLRYLDDRMADNKPPRKYDASYAHSRFRFIDKKWIPDTVSPLDNELEDAFEPTQRGQQKLVFCPKEHRGVIREMYRIFMHLHPQTPSPFHAHQQLNASEIHAFAMNQVYTYCRKHELLSVGISVESMVSAKAVETMESCRGCRHT